MTNEELVRASLDQVQSYMRLDDGLRVTTHCMFPTGSLVQVVVRGGKEALRVTDDGAAVREASSVGLDVGPVKHAFASIVRRQGLHISNNAIIAPEVPAEGVGAAIVIVANASKHACEWCFDHFRYSRPRKFKEILAQLVDQQFGDDAKKHVQVLGASNKQQMFEFAVPRDDRLVLIDSVVPDPASINSRIVSNLDVRNLRSSRYEQYIVYDDEDKWRASDLQLLRMAADIVPFSTARTVFGGIVR